VIKTCPSNRADHSLGVRVLPRRGWRRQHFLLTGGCNLPTEACAEFSVTIAEEIGRRVIQTDGLEILSCSPFRSRRLGHIGVQDLSPIVTEDYWYEQDSDGRGRYGEKVSRNDIVGVVLKEGSPSL